MPIIIATKDDIPQLKQLVNKAYRTNEGWTHETDILEGQRIDAVILEEMINDERNTILIDVKDNTIIGCVCLERQKDQFYLGMLTVDPTVQQQGIGRKLLEAGEAYCQEAGGNRVEMTVISMRKELIEWYERRGYRDNGERKPFPAGDHRFGVPLKEIEFIVMEKVL